MKKLLVPLAALACCAAHAQGSVTLFGLLDAAIGYGRGSTANNTVMLNSGLLSSRVGFRGIEDLGSGRSASFWLEAGIANDNGSGNSTSINNQGNGVTALGGGLTFNRRSTVSLASTRWGELRFGRDYTPTFTTLSLTDPFYVTGTGASQAVLGQIAPGAPWSTTGGVNGPVARASNSLAYYLPANTTGVYGGVQHYFGENPSNAANADDGTGTSLRLGWANVSLDVAASISRTQYLTGDITESAIAGIWTTGWGKLHLAVNRDSVSGGLPGGRGWLVGATVPVGTGRVLASYSSYEVRSAAEPGARKIALAYVYPFSKRTSAYAIAARLSNSGTSAQALNGSITAAGTASRGYTLGITHAF
jgi:predicted porin